MPSAYVIQVAHRDTGVIVAWEPGLGVEADLIENLCARVKAKGVGVGRSEAIVIAHVRTAFVELITDLKRRV